MSEPQTAMQTTNGPREGTLKWYLAQPGYRARFEEMLGKRATQFMASIINVSSAKNFERVEPRSIIASAAVAATLDLPIDKNLGFAWIVPYAGKAQFQLGWKGVVQLALRSGQYAGMNAFTVNREALGGYNEIGDPIIIWDNLDETKEAVGYAFAWRLVTGFSKVVYWSKRKVQAHAARYSQAYKAGRKDSPWFTDFDKMALKTVIMNALRSWGILTVEMRQAIDLDQTAAIDIDATPIYLDNEAMDEADESPKVDKAAALTERLREENALQVAEPEPQAAAAREPGEEEPESFPEVLSLYRDAFVAATDAAGRNRALATVAPYFQSPPDEASDDELRQAADALNELVAEYARSTVSKKK